MVILPAFGASLEEMQYLDGKGVTTVDTTCPWVSKVWGVGVGVGVGAGLGVGLATVCPGGCPRCEATSPQATPKPSPSLSRHPAQGVDDRGQAPARGDDLYHPWQVRARGGHRHRLHVRRTPRTRNP